MVTGTSDFVSVYPFEMPLSSYFTTTNCPVALLLMSTNHKQLTCLIWALETFSLLPWQSFAHSPPKQPFTLTRLLFYSGSYTKICVNPCSIKHLYRQPRSLFIWTLKNPFNLHYIRHELCCTLNNVCTSLLDSFLCVNEWEVGNVIFLLSSSSHWYFIEHHKRKERLYILYLWWSGIIFVSQARNITTWPIRWPFV